MSEVIKTNGRKQFNDLNVLPRYDRSLVDYSKYYEELIGINGIAFSQRKFLKKIRSNRSTSLENQAEASRI